MSHRPRCIVASISNDRGAAISLLSDNTAPQERKNERLGAFTVVAASPLRAEYSHIDQLLCYFEDRTHHKRLARRADISPAALKAYLPDVCLMTLEYDTAGRLSDGIMTLMGTNVASFYGEVTGKRISSYATSEVSERIMACARACVELKAPVVASAHSLSQKKNHLAVQVLYVPLAEDGTHIDRLFLHLKISMGSAEKHN